MKLWEIDKEIERLLEGAVDEETGEIDEAVFEKLDELQMAKADKVESCCLVYKNLARFAEDLKAEKIGLEQRQKQAERIAERMKNYIKYSLNGEKFETVKAKVSYRRTTSVSIYDMDVLPEEYLRYKDPEPDKTKIKDAIVKGGLKVPGALMIESVSMSIK